MTSPPDRSMDAIAGLLQERQQYEIWLTALDAKQATTPPHVYTRVRADYEARLQRVLEQLSGRGAELQQAVEANAARLANLQREEAARRDARHEAELRASVGEYTAQQWAEVSRTADEEIARLSGERASVQSELTRLQQLAASTTGVSSAAGAVAGAPGLAADQHVPRSAAPEPQVAAAQPGTAASPAPAQGGGRGFDDLEFLKSIGAAPGGAAARAPQPQPADATPGQQSTDGASAQSAGAAAAPSAHGGAAAQRPGLPSGLEQPGGLAAAASSPTGAAPAGGDSAGLPGHSPAAAPGQPSAGAPDQRAYAQPQGPEHGDRQPAAPSPQPVAASQDAPGSMLPGAAEPRTRPRHDTGSVPSFLRDVPQENVKTLKCIECGSMNYPTEWYCERCGSELAAL